MTPTTIVPLGGLLLLLAVPGCCFSEGIFAPCGDDFVPRCEANVRVVCRSDRVLPRHVERTECDGQCLARGDIVECVASPPTPCEPGEFARCTADGRGVLTCVEVGEQSYVGDYVQPCTGRCYAAGGNADCIAEPRVTCQSVEEPLCSADGTSILTCLQIGDDLFVSDSASDCSPQRCVVADGFVECR